MFKRRLNPVIFLDKRKFKVQEEKNKTIYCVDFYFLKQ